MNLAKRRMNLHIFDGPSGEGSGNSAAGAESVTGDTTTTDTDTRVSQGDGTESANNTQDANANTTQGSEKTAEEQKAFWDSYRKGEGKQFVDAHIQNIINKRYSETKQYESQLSTLQPLLAAIAEDYGIENSEDMSAVVNAYLNNEQRLIDRAAKNGMSVDQQKRFDNLQNENEVLRQKQALEERAANASALRAQWDSETQKIVETLDPDFSLDEAFENQEFYDAVVKQNLPLEMAYFCAFQDRYNEMISAKAEKKVTDSIKARGQRVPENGSGAQATATSQVNVANLTPKQILEYAKKAERGEIIDFKTRY